MAWAYWWARPLSALRWEYSSGSVSVSASGPAELLPVRPAAAGFRWVQVTESGMELRWFPPAWEQVFPGHLSVPPLEMAAGWLSVRLLLNPAWEQAFPARLSVPPLLNPAWERLSPALRSELLLARLSVILTEPLSVPAADSGFQPAGCLLSGWFDRPAALYWYQKAAPPGPPLSAWGSEPP